jgi:hypothetical protein
MHDSIIIRRFLAAFFLLLFSFCVTPKRFLHDLLANHRDAQTIKSIPQQQVASSGFHCHIDDLVVVEPFLPGVQPTLVFDIKSEPARYTKPVISLGISEPSPSGNRGPPASFCS